MSIQTELSRLQQAKSELRNLLISAGINVPTYTTIDQYPALFEEALTMNAVYSYKVTFYANSWTAIGSNYRQTASVTPLYGAPAISSSFAMASTVSIDDSYPEETYNEMREAASVIDNATKTLRYESMICVTKNGERPTADVEVYFLARKVP